MAVQTDWGRRDALCDWLTANGIDPHDVPVDGDLAIVDTDAGRAIRVEVELRSEDGRVLLDEREHRAARELRTVPLVVEPPDWWEPYEKPTRATLLTAVERVRALHVRNANTSDCEHCSERDYPDYSVPFPCPTIRALDEP
jgi:hypothetical protein